VVGVAVVVGVVVVVVVGVGVGVAVGVAVVVIPLRTVLNAHPTALCDIHRVPKYDPRWVSEDKIGA
jgi:hypothetical protein